MKDYVTSKERMPSEIEKINYFVKRDAYFIALFMVAFIVYIIHVANTI